MAAILATRRVRIPNYRPTLLLIVVLLAAFSVGLRLLLRPDTSAAPNNLPALSSVFTPEVRHWSPLIYAWAAAYNVDPNLIATVIQI
ncbi:hypothetical protein NL529_27730, partial [Klebsiella pneumoniae]|nr:hypothetical protein [Klebsiella pneumoniae]